MIVLVSVLPCEDATLLKRVVSLCQNEASQCVCPRNEVDVPSNFPKFVPITVTKDAPKVIVLGGATLVTSQKSNEKEAVNDVRRCSEASGSIAKVAITGNPYDAPVINSVLMLESEFHSVVSQADPPYRIVGEYCTRPKLRPNVVMEYRPEVAPFVRKMELNICAS